MNADESSRNLASPLRLDTNFSSTIEGVASLLAAQAYSVTDTPSERIFRQYAIDILSRLAHCDLESMVQKRMELLGYVEKQDKKLKTVDF